MTSKGSSQCSAANSKSDVLVFSVHTSRGKQARRSSDVDVLVEFSKSIDLLDFVALERYLANQTGVKIDLVSIKALRPEFRGTILNEVIWISSNAAFRLNR
jgi:predicted nucleotidyltransferase